MYTVRFSNQTASSFRSKI